MPEKRKCPMCKTNPASSRGTTCGKQKCQSEFRAQARLAKDIPKLEETCPEIKQDFELGTWRISAKQVRIHSLDELIKHFEVDTSIWTVKKFECVAHEMGMAPRPTRTSKTDWVLPDRRALIVPLYNIRAEFEKNKAVASAKGILDELKKEIAGLGKMPATRKQPFLTTSFGYCLELGPPDVHFGKLAWGPETGWENYDLKEALELWETGVWDLLSRAPKSKLEKIWFPLGNDMLHFDNKAQTTTQGTPQDGDSRYHKVFCAAQALMIKTIDRMREIAPVEIYGVPGNHDTLAAWHMTNSLEMAFRDCKQVQVNNSANLRKYAQFGNMMVLWAHGNALKTHQYPGLMAREQPEMFCSSKFFEAHVGHIHQTKVQDLHVGEAMGVRVRTMPSISGTDAWHAEKGFVGNIRSIESYLYDKKDGLVTTNHWNVPAEITKSKGSN